MNSPAHHPAISTLMAFGAGSYDEAYSAVIASHLAVCPECRAQVRLFETVGGTLLANEAQAAMSGDALEKLLLAADADPRQTGPEAPRLPAELPLPLRRYLPHGLAGARWLFAGLGVSVAHVPLHPNTPSRLMLMRMQAGRRSEVHSHDGQELMLVLSGAYRDEFGAYKVGDLADMEGDVEHAPTALDDQECICVVAVGGPMTFRSKFIQMLAPILRL